MHRNVEVHNSTDPSTHRAAYEYRKSTCKKALCSQLDSQQQPSLQVRDASSSAAAFSRSFTSNTAGALEQGPIFRTHYRVYVVSFWK